MLTIKDLNDTDFIQPRGNEKIFLHKDLAMETPICRYIPVDFLLEMLTSQKMYVSNRRNLNDKREQGIKEDLRDMFIMCPWDRNKKRMTQELKRRSQLHQDAYSTCVSCWTERIDESIMFWHCYGQNTCRISTTIGQLINSIKQLSNTIVIAPILYKDKDRTEIVYDKIFSKHKAYADEQEIRLCVLNNEHHIYLNVNLEILINDITINPFFSKSYQQFIKESIEGRYNFLLGKIKYSHLLEYKS